MVRRNKINGVWWIFRNFSLEWYNIWYMNEIAHLPNRTECTLEKYRKAIQRNAHKVMRKIKLARYSWGKFASAMVVFDKLRSCRTLIRHSVSIAASLLYYTHVKTVSIVPILLRRERNSDSQQAEPLEKHVFPVRCVSMRVALAGKMDSTWNMWEKTNDRVLVCAYLATGGTMAWEHGGTNAVEKMPRVSDTGKREEKEKLSRND